MGLPPGARVGQGSSVGYHVGTGTHKVGSMVGMIHLVGVGVGGLFGFLVAVGTEVLVGAGDEDGRGVELGKGVLVELSVDLAGGLGVDDGKVVLVGMEVDAEGGSGGDVDAEVSLCVPSVVVGLGVEDGMGVERPTRVTVFVGTRLAAMPGDVVADTERSGDGVALAGWKEVGVLVRAGAITGIME